MRKPGWVAALLILAACTAALLWREGVVPFTTAPDDPGMEVRIDVNRAGPVELQAVPGIGPATARRIVEHRLRKGPFKSVGDLVAVEGLGDARVRSLSGYLVAGGQEEGGQ